MKSLVKFRLTQKKDIPFFRMLMLQKGVLQAHPMENEKEVDLASKNWEYYIDNGVSVTVIYKKKVVGIANLHINTVEKLSHQCSLMIAIDENYRGIGIGGLLMKELMAMAKRKGIELLHLEVVATQDVALCLYNSLGFQKYGIIPKAFRTRDNEYFDKILMQKFL